jgi:hypothetical protein
MGLFADTSSKMDGSCLNLRRSFFLRLKDRVRTMLQSEFISGAVWRRYRKVREMVNGAGGFLASNFPRLDE